MTWNDFKKFVDEKIAAAGGNGDITLEAVKFHSSSSDRIDVLVENLDRGPEAAIQVWTR
jgi:hypothetical protein